MTDQRRGGDQTDPPKPKRGVGWYRVATTDDVPRVSPSQRDKQHERSAHLIRSLKTQRGKIKKISDEYNPKAYGHDAVVRKWDVDARQSGRYRPSASHKKLDHNYDHLYECYRKRNIRGGRTVEVDLTDQFESGDIDGVIEKMKGVVSDVKSKSKKI